MPRGRCATSPGHSGSRTATNYARKPGLFVGCAGDMPVRGAVIARLRTITRSPVVVERPMLRRAHGVERNLVFGSARVYRARPLHVAVGNGRRRDDAAGLWAGLRKRVSHDR